MRRLFERQEKETEKAYAAFSAYLSMGQERSLLKTAKAVGKGKQMIEQWSVRWRWRDRVSAYNDHLSRVEREATEAIARSRAAEWLTRQEQLKQTEWEMHEKAIAAARKGLAKFMENEDAKASLSEIARLLEVASRMGRLASGLATDKTEITGEDGGPIQIELSAALDKVYGSGEIVDAEEIAPNEIEEGGEA